MKKQQWILVIGAVAVAVALFFIGNTVPDAKPAAANADMADGHSPNDGHNHEAPAAVTIDTVLLQAKKLLTTEDINKLAQLEQTEARGDVKAQQLEKYKQLAKFWDETTHNHTLYHYYTGEAAKLENSEKKLTFAARFFLEEVMASGQPSAFNTWQANQAKELFEKAIEINPANDSAKIAIGACYMFGNISTNPMEGILKVREIAEKKPDNVYAQLVLGLGGLRSGQYDKAIERFTKVVTVQPKNLEAIFHLAETYDRKGDKTNAVVWYQKASDLIKIPEAKKEIEARIKALKS
ncbi:MAG: hypothetical protein EAZ47_04505 [Bacteroidetes bacterium]|nr:MAG: hypothetical protein EAY72_00970 [Bacteroidota bacterium]TAE70308.1 MAG: hypothetical protein EAY68_02865 [Bacteroidota bacterium]TAF94163.1 MAG: hypothetical protein EAZ47_04505 [Bacteroidota bacterium]